MNPLIVGPIRLTSTDPTPWQISSPRSQRISGFQVLLYTMVRSCIVPTYQNPSAYFSSNTIAYNLILSSDTHPFLISVKDFEASLHVNTVSVYAAAKHAVEGFDKLPKSTLKSFIFTGNILNISPIPRLLALGAGKSASAYIIESAARAYVGKRYQ